MNHLDPNSRSISPEDRSPWKRSKIISEDFEKLIYIEKGKISGDVMREANLLPRSYKDPLV